MHFNGIHPSSSACYSVDSIVHVAINIRKARLDKKKYKKNSLLIQLQALRRRIVVCYLFDNIALNQENLHRSQLVLSKLKLSDNRI